jgi:group II intron reverse transcriptase/maturase
MSGEKTKSFAVSESMVHRSYEKVCDKKGGAGIDKETIDLFNGDLIRNLYKIWNRMSSGSYFPPAVRTVLIPKKQGGTRPLGIPTVSDRIAQGVVKDYLEPILEPLFHVNSFGYRPGRSTHDALLQCQENCIRYAWVIDLDIKGFFDNINHDWMMKMLRHHTQEKWVLLYSERWLKAGVEQPDGSIMARVKGTPQGGVISPLLSNLYLHHAFDMWMGKFFGSNPFERYADDIIVHCENRQEAEQLLVSIKERLQKFELELHPEKTKLVYCKNYRRKEEHEHNSFTFLSYSFQPRGTRVHGSHNRYTAFSAAISGKAKAFIRQRIRQVFHPRNTQVPLEDVAIKLNPKIRGWLNYYCRFNAWIARQVFLYLNELIRKWIKEKYRISSKAALWDKYRSVVLLCKNLFVHWQQGIIY